MAGIATSVNQVRKPERWAGWYADDGVGLGLGLGVFRVAYKGCSECGWERWKCTALGSVHDLTVQAVKRRVRDEQANRLESRDRYF